MICSIGVGDSVAAGGNMCAVLPLLPPLCRPCAGNGDDLSGEMPPCVGTNGKFPAISGVGLPMKGDGVRVACAGSECPFVVTGNWLRVDIGGIRANSIPSGDLPGPARSWSFDFGASST